MFKCHCRDCQHVTGGPYSPVVYLPLKSFKITNGSLSHYATESMAFRKNLRGFCSTCGSRISGGETEAGIGIVAGSLGGSTLFRSQVEMHVADAEPWDSLDPAIPKFDRYPPM